MFYLSKLSEHKNEQNIKPGDNGFISLVDYAWWIMHGGLCMVDYAWWIMHGGLCMVDNAWWIMHGG